MQRESALRTGNKRLQAEQAASKLAGDFPKALLQLGFVCVLLVKTEFLKILLGGSSTKRKHIFAHERSPPARFSDWNYVESYTQRWEFVKGKKKSDQLFLIQSPSLNLGNLTQDRVQQMMGHPFNYTKEKY